MDLVLKIIVLCVIIISCGRAESKHHHDHITPRSSNITETQENYNKTLTLRQHLDNCTEEHKINPDIVLKLRSGKLKRLRKETEGLKKWSLCILVKSGMMSQNGVLKQDVVLASVPDQDKPKVEKAIDKCLYRKRRQPHEIAWHYVRCFRSLFPKYSIL